MAEQRDESSEPVVVTHSPSGTTRRRGSVGRERPADEAVGDFRGAGVAAGAVVLLAAAVLIVVVVAQNGERVAFEFLWWDATVPLALLLLIAAVATVVIDQVVGMVWRYRRRRVRAVTSELRHG
jgi:uncharacterized integral membrane protein